ncbi:hypothetical protein CPER28S_01000 [Cellulomonas persica]
MKKSSLPVARAWSMTCCVQDCQNSMFTCLTVSIRKPSIPKSTQSEKICAMPSTTTGFSVMRSSSAPKSPSVEDSPAYVELPRLWYSVGSLSQAGTLTSASSSLTTGVYGNDVAGSSSGNVRPTTSASRNASPSASV